MAPSPPLTEELVDLARRVAVDAGALVRSAAGNGRASVTTKSSATDLVTDTDRASEALIVSAILDARPTDEIVGEEGAAVAGTSGVRWVIDPIDGTTNFVYGHPGYAVSIAAEFAGQTVAGVVLDVLANQTFWAGRGLGSFADDTVLSVGTCDSMASALIATGFNYRADLRANQGSVMAQLLPRIADIRRMGGCALDLCSVAMGRVDAYFERGVQPWDHAAGALIAAEAGAVVSDLRGDPPNSTMCVAAIPAIYDALVDALGELGADAPISPTT